MLFNSVHFFLFFPIICILYWAVRYIARGESGVKIGNILLLVGSYYFYMCWSVEYVFLLFGCTLITYLSALGISYFSAKRSRLTCLVTGIVINISLLFFFKYFNFAALVVSDVVEVLGIKMTVPDFGILLPVGISFYIFQAVGYSIDVYRGAPAERNFFTYALFVSFFPQLVAGPIERSTNLMKQFHTGGTFSYEQTVEGMKMMIWGFFLKLVLADRCAEYVDTVYNHIHINTGSSMLLGGFIFTFQIYGDFAGYSLIAIGVAKILGFTLIQNFKEPYLSVSITDFWRRWHISLSTWFKDYIYIPLGGNRVGKVKTYRNLMITFLVSGLWHGANWTFILWGVYHGIFQCIERMIGWHNKVWHGFARVCHTLLTFVLVMFAWILFRANSLADVVYIYKCIFTDFGTPYMPYVILIYVVFAIGLTMARDAIVNYNLPIHISDSKYPAVRFAYMVVMILIIIGLGALNGSKFIYFQF